MFIEWVELSMHHKALFYIKYFTALKVPPCRVLTLQEHYSFLFKAPVYIWSNFVNEYYVQENVKTQKNKKNKQLSY